MRAFVLSGGANYGALQAGALEVLLARGFQPDMLVGVSAGALNAAWLAAHPTLEGARQLASIWCNSAPLFFRPIDSISPLLRLVRGKDSLLRNDPLQQFICTWASTESTLGEFTHPRLYVAAVCLADGVLRVFGDDPNDRLMDALMASTAVPPLYPPWRVDGMAYVDGGVISDLPLRVAVERGAKEIFALHISPPPLSSSGAPSRRALTIGERALSMLVDRQARLEIELVRQQRIVRLHLIRLYAEFDPGFWNFSHADDLIVAGRRRAEAYLLEGKTLLIPARVKAWLRRLRAKLERVRLSPLPPTRVSS